MLEFASRRCVTTPTCLQQAPVACGLVSIEGWDRLTPACTQTVLDGMVVETHSEQIETQRRWMLSMLLRHYRADPTEHDNELTELIRQYKPWRMADCDEQPRFTCDSDPNPFIHVDMNKCILCTRCVRACQEVQGRFVLGVGQRGEQAHIIAGHDTNMLDARCESCGACAAYCPTDALQDRVAIACATPDKLVTTTCSYCGVGCQFDLNVKDNKILRVTSNPEAPVNGMSLCVKGRYGFDYVHHHERLTEPLVRRHLVEPAADKDHRDDWVPVPWDDALDLVARKLVTVKQESGSDAVGVLASAKCTNEENYLMQKFARQIVGTNNVDHCARLCHSSTVAGLAMAFGSGAMSNSMHDIADNSQAVFIIGSNTTEQHPVFGTMLRQAVLQRGLKLVVADPRKIDITEFATLHIRQRPGTDVALINGLMHIILENDWHDSDFIRERCEGFDEFAEILANYPPDRVSETTGVSEEDLYACARILATNCPMAVIWAMGITQHTTGVLNVLSLANLQMLLGNMGVSGGGVNPLRGQNNVQGACDLGALPNVYSGYQKVTDAEVHNKFGNAWATSGDISTTCSMSPGRTVTEMVEAAGHEDIRALYILGEDPAMTEPDCNKVRQALARSEFIVLQEIFPSETSHFADVLLPGTTFAEKSGTFTNTERRVQLVRPAIEPIGNARPDWQITSELARRVLALEQRVPNGPQAAWNYSSAAEIMDEIAAVTPSYAGVSHERLEQGEQLQWPVLDGEHTGTPILHVGKFTRGKGKFHAVDHLPANELPDTDYPLLLTTGRVIYHWHGGELTRRSVGLSEIYPETLIEVSREDALTLGHCRPLGSYCCITSRQNDRSRHRD